MSSASFGNLHAWSDDALSSAATLAALALAAPGEGKPARSNVLEVTCPYGSYPGETLEVKIPHEAGGGYVCTTIPRGTREGEVFDVRLD